MRISARQSDYDRGASLVRATIALLLCVLLARASLESVAGIARLAHAGLDLAIAFVTERAALLEKHE